MTPDAYRARVHKFSCKPPDHNAARHRARVKGHIAELEALLASTQSQLADALKQIETLTAEVERLRRALGSRPDDPEEVKPPVESESRRDNVPGMDTASSPDQTVSEVPDTPTSIDLSHDTPSTLALSPSTTVASPPCCCTETTNASLDESQCGQANRSSEAGVTLPNLTTTNPSHPPAGDSIHPANTIAEMEDPNDDHPLLPPPQPGESTITCREAFEMLRDHILNINGASSPDLDLSAAAEWLRPGFRRAVVPGSGCRVQTHILFAFVDRVMSG
jgi:hypothetical protein